MRIASLLTVLVSSAAAGQEIPAQLLRELPASVTVAVAFDAAGDRLMTAGPTLIQVWDVKSWKAVGAVRSDGAPFALAALSPDGQRLLTARGTEVRAWDVDTGRGLQVFKHPAEVRTCAFSPDGSRVMTACADGAARVWDVNGGGAAAGPVAGTRQWRGDEVGVGGEV